MSPSLEQTFRCTLVLSQVNRAIPIPDRGMCCIDDVSTAAFLLCFCSDPLLTCEGAVLGGLTTFSKILLTLYLVFTSMEFRQELCLMVGTRH